MDKISINIYLDNMHSKVLFDDIDKAIELTFIDASHSQLDNVLFFKGDTLFHKSAQGEIHFDWVKMLSSHHNKKYSLSKEPFAKALKIKANNDSLIADLTCGSGKDAMLLLAYGARLELYERNPIVYLLCFDALRRLKKSTLFDSDLSIYKEPMLNFGQITKSECHKFDALYYDPMFPPKKKKSALARKEMEVFKNIVGSDQDICDFLKTLIGNHPHIVLKRPIKEEKFFKNAISYTGKTTRYDVYLNHIA